MSSRTAEAVFVFKNKKKRMNGPITVKEDAPIGYTLEAMYREGLLNTKKHSFASCPSCYTFGELAWKGVASHCAGMSDSIFITKEIEVTDGGMDWGLMRIAEAITDYKKLTKTASYLVIAPISHPDHANMLCIRITSFLGGGDLTWAVYEPHGTEGEYYQKTLVFVADMVNKLGRWLKLETITPPSVAERIGSIKGSMQSWAILNADLETSGGDKEGLTEFREDVAAIGGNFGNCATFCNIMSFLAGYFDTVNLHELESDIIRVYTETLANYDASEERLKSLFYGGTDNMARNFSVNLAYSVKDAALTPSSTMKSTLCCSKGGGSWVNWNGERV